MRCFVAGGTGVIGRRVVPMLVGRGHDVTVLSRLPDRDRMIRAMGATPARVDLFDLQTVVGATAGHDAVINLTTHIPPLRVAAKKAAWVENDRIRTWGVSNLVEAARTHEVARFVQESVTFHYADSGKSWVDEATSRVASDMSASVDLAERAVEDFTSGGGVGVILRFGQFYAPDSSHTRSHARAFRRGINPFIGSGEGHLPLIGMPAAARAVVAALDAEAGVYNVADDDPPQRSKIGESVAKKVGRSRCRSIPTSLTLRLAPGAEFLMRSHRISNRKLTEATGWRPDDTAATGLARAIAEVLR